MGAIKGTLTHSANQPIITVLFLPLHSDAEYGNSEQLVEESTDIYNLIVKANYSADKAAGYKAFFSEQLPKHLEHLEKLVAHGNLFNSKVLLGDLAVFAVLDTIMDLNNGILEGYPKLAAFYAHVKAIPSIAAAINGLPAYFKTE